jgi:hypothetical protein
MQKFIEKFFDVLASTTLMLTSFIVLIHDVWSKTDYAWIFLSILTGCGVFAVILWAMRPMD